MSAYYNEIEPFAAQWLTNLCAAGHIPPGDVDSRSIVEVQPQSLEQYDEAHFFAGIGIWARALRDAGWPTTRVPVWSGSCPCQPFSAAGKQRGTADERHLWPVWFQLIRSCRPPVVFGEQVASRDALAWLDVVFADLEAEGYTCWAVDLCAAGVGAPHIRQRLWFVAIRLADAGCVGQYRESSAWVHERRTGASSEGCATHGADGSRRDHDAGCGDDDRMAISMRDGLEDRFVAGTASSATFRSADVPDDRWPSATNGAWGAADWLFCRDGRWRPVESGTQPLADGSPNRVGRLRAYGNAICLPVATTFVQSVMEALGIDPA